MENLQIKEILKLEQKKYREKYEKYLVYGEHIVVEGLLTGNIQEILIAEEKYNNFVNTYEQQLKEKKIKIRTVTKQTLEKFKGVKTIPNYIGIAKFINNKIDDKANILGLNNISDPGNLGTMIRSARAFGINNIILDEATVDLYNPKVIQAIQGAQFEMNIVKMDLFKYCQKSSLQIYTTYLDVENEIDIIQNSDKHAGNFILLMGNESQGMEKKFKELKHKNIKLKIAYESLNVAVAAGIIMYGLTTKGEK